MLNETSRAHQKAETRAAILEAARDEFERSGFDGANLRTIAARAGVTAGNVVHHFGDKKELLHAALFDELDRTLRRALASQRGGTLEGELRLLGKAVFQGYRARPSLSRTLLKESLFADDPWKAQFLAQVQDVQRSIEARVVRAITRGELPKDTAPPLVAAAWLSFFYFALIGWAQGAVKDPVALVATLFHAHLGARTPRRAP